MNAGKNNDVGIGFSRVVVAGKIEGVLCRGQVEIQRLTWEPGRLRVALLSGREQTIRLATPATIRRIESTSGEARIADAEDDRTRLVTLPEGRPVTLEIEQTESMAV